MKKRHKYILFLFLTFIILGFMSFFSVKTVIAHQAKNEILIYLDAGHGGFDGGATSYDEHTIEKDITLKTCLYLKSYLEKTGFKVKMTRTTDKALAKNKRDDILKRVSLINKSKCNIYISIHANAYPSKTVKGAQTFFTTRYDENLLLATKIMNYLYTVDATNKRVAKELNGKYLLDNTNKIGCLVELGFLTNELDLALLTSDDGLAKVASLIYLGILDYLEEQNGKTND